MKSNPPPHDLQTESTSRHSRVIGNLYYNNVVSAPYVYLLYSYSLDEKYKILSSDLELEQMTFVEDHDTSSGSK